MAVYLPPDVLAAHPEWGHLLNGTPGPQYAPPPLAAGGPAYPNGPTWHWGGTGITAPSGNSPQLNQHLSTGTTFGPPMPAPTPTNTPSWQQSLLNSTNNLITSFTPQGYTGNATPQSDSTLPSVAQTDQFGNPNPAVLEYNARRDLQGAQNARNLAEQNYYNLQQQQGLPADAAVNAARSAQLAGQSQYLLEQQRFNTQQQTETAAIQAAKLDPNDAKQVAMGQRLQDNQTFKYRLAGLAAPIEVTMPPGYNGPMPVGTVAKIQTLAQQLETIYGNADALEKFRVEAARIHSEQLGQDVTAADIAKGNVSLTLQEAQLAVDRAGLNQTEASQGVQDSQLPPAAGLVPYTNPEDGSFQWVTPSQLTELQRVDSRNRTLQTNAEMGAAGLSLSSLETYASEVNNDGTPVMGEDQLISILQQRGTDPATIQQVLDRVHYLQQQHRSNPFQFGLPSTAPPASPSPSALPSSTAPAPNSIPYDAGAVPPPDQP